MSKKLFDDYAKFFFFKKNKIIGFRFFNVYGNNENHKGKMASVISKNLFNKSNIINLFGKYKKVKPGKQQRDFIYVLDVVNTLIWSMKNKNIKNGIYNLGTGKARSFFDLANAIIKLLPNKRINFIKFPEELKQKYQSYTCANIQKLRKSGYVRKFTPLEKGIKDVFDKKNN